MTDRMSKEPMTLADLPLLSSAHVDRRIETVGILMDLVRKVQDGEYVLLEELVDYDPPEVDSSTGLYNSTCYRLVFRVVQPGDFEE